MNSALSPKPVPGDLQYFGRMGASLSHEIKNSLAIINENAGLISDLLAMGEERLVTNAGRFASILERISKQVGRADEIVRRMNAFSHSVDLPEQQIDLFEAIRLSAALGGRISANQGIKIIPENPEAPVYVSGSFYALLHLLWLVMETAMAGMETDSELRVKPLERDGVPGILFSAGTGAEQGLTGLLDSKEGQDALAGFPARAVIENQGQQMMLSFQG